MSADLQVVNLALATLHKDPADSLEAPKNSYERWAKALLPDALNTALVAWWWPDVRKRRVIGPSQKAEDVLEFGEGKRFALPGDCLKVHRVRNLDSQEWKRERGFIIADTDKSIWLHYYAATSTDQCDPLLRRVIAAQLAMDIARAVSDSQTALDRAMDRYEYWFARAAGSAGEEAGIANRRDQGSEEMAWAGLGYGRFSAVERSKG